MKSLIIERLRQADILLPALIAEGLAANDRVKARLSVLQAAGRHAREPQRARFDMTDECRTAGIDSAVMDMLINGASLLADEQIAAPGVAKLGTAIWDDIACMVHAVEVGNSARGDDALARLSAIKQAASLGASDTVELAQIARLTGLSDSKATACIAWSWTCTKALNRLSAAHAEEVLAGAHVYGMLPQDRPAVEAFMRGVESDRRLKFDHPGLATTATRSGARLTIQNDIGETDAHVVVIAVEAEAVIVTYTDVHLARARNLHRPVAGFFRAIERLDRKSAEGLGDDGVFYLVDRPLSDRWRQALSRLARSDWRIAGLPDRLEQGPQGVTRLGV